MTNFRSRVIISLAVCVLFVNAAFAFDGGDGTSENPYQISTPEHLMEVGTDIYHRPFYHIMTNDIDLSEYIFKTAVIAPNPNNINDEFHGYSFRGSFDGNGYKITNLTIDTLSDNDPNNDNNGYLGLFGCLGEGGEISNLSLLNINISSKGNIIGGLLGCNGYFFLPGGSIINCYTSGKISGNSYIGGLIGKSGQVGFAMNLDKGRYFESSSFGGPVTNCYSSCCISGENNIGGLIGYSNSRTINKCYAIGSISGFYNIGGLIGVKERGVVTNCYATGTVEGGINVGGLIGIKGFVFRSEDSRGNDYSITIEDPVMNCYSTGLVKGDESVGGLIGNNTLENISNCFWDTQASGLTTSDGGIGLTTSQMQTLATFTDAGWDFDSTWWINDGRDYPKLSFQPFGDLNNDSRVNTADLAIMSASWTMDINDEGVDRSCELSGDNTIDTADLSALIDMWLAGPWFGD